MNRYHHSALGLLLFTLAALGACARQGSPTGGPKDTTPPRIIEEKSTPNFSLFFTERVITLHFDEWVTLRDANAQVVVSPSLQKRPDIKIKGKAVILSFDTEEILRPNTTYAIQFGTAVRDFREDNPAENLRFVFSTGAYLDSLRLSGVVADAYTSEPIEKMIVALYEDFTDSVAHFTRPLYVTRTDKTGAFAFENLRATPYKLLAFEDPDQDLRWRGGADKIGFWPEPVIAQADSAPVFRLAAFRDQSTPRIIGRELGQYGRIGLYYTGSPDTLSVRADRPDLRLWSKAVGDTLQIWYDQDSVRAWKLLVGSDTLAVRALQRAEFLQKRRIVFADEATRGESQRRFGAPTTKPALKTIQQHPDKPGMLQFDAPITRFDPGLFTLMRADTIPQDSLLTVWADTTDQTRLFFNPGWLQESVYTLRILPGALTDCYGVANADTLSRKFAVPEYRRLGDLILKLTNLKPGVQYVLRILQGPMLEDTRTFVAESSAMSIAFRRIQPVNYTAELIEDLNANGRWDAGSYYQGRQAEPVRIKKLAPLRSNWEVEETLGWDAPPASER